MIDPRTRNEFVYFHREELSDICTNKLQPDVDLANEIISKARTELNYSNNYQDDKILETLLNIYRKLRPNLDIMQTAQIQKIIKGKTPVHVIEEAEGSSIDLAASLHRLRTTGNKKEALKLISQDIATAQISLMQLKELIGSDYINDIIEGKLKNLKS